MNRNVDLVADFLEHSEQPLALARAHVLEVVERVFGRQAVRFGRVLDRRCGRVDPSRGFEAPGHAPLGAHCAEAYSRSGW
jgi:hypothetical protein